MTTDDPLSVNPLITENRAALRDWSNLLMLWRLCGRPACRRACACRNDPRICFARNHALLPRDMQDWFATLGRCKTLGTSFDGALELIETSTIAGALRDWHAAVGRSVGWED